MLTQRMHQKPTGDPLAHTAYRTIGLLVSDGRPFPVTEKVDGVTLLQERSRCGMQPPLKGLR